MPLPPLTHPPPRSSPRISDAQRPFEDAQDRWRLLDSSTRGRIQGRRREASCTRGQGGRGRVGGVVSLIFFVVPGTESDVGCSEAGMEAFSWRLLLPWICPSNGGISSDCPQLIDAAPGKYSIFDTRCTGLQKANTRSRWKHTHTRTHTHTYTHVRKYPFFSHPAHVHPHIRHASTPHTHTHTHTPHLTRMQHTHTHIAPPHTHTHSHEVNAR